MGPVATCSLAVLLSACSTVSDLPPRYTLDSDGSEGLAIVALTLSGKDMAAVSEFEYRVRKADRAGEEVRRKTYFLSGVFSE